MEKQANQSTLVTILTQKRIVANTVLNYFGYAHNAVFLLSVLCSNTRTFLKELKANLPTFFESFKVNLKN